MITEKEVLDILPPTGTSWVGDHVRWAVKLGDAHCLYHLGSALIAMSQISKVKVRFGAMKVSPNVFLTLIGDSSISRKTASSDLVADILAAAMPGAQYEEPASEQGMVEMVRKTRHGFFYWPEFGSFLDQASAGPLSSIKTRLNTVYDGGPLGHARAGAVRAGSSSGPIRDYSVSLIGCVTPGYLEEFTTSVDWNDGFFARFLAFYPNIKERDIDPTTLPTAPDKDKRGDALNELKALYKSPNLSDSGGAQNFAEQLQFDEQIAKRFVGLKPAALSLWQDWYSDIQERAKAARFGPAIVRAPSNAMKVALLMAFDQQRDEILGGGEWSFGYDQMMFAIRVAEFHIRSIFDLGGQLAENKAMRSRKLVLQNISNNMDSPSSFSDIIRGSRLLKRDIVPILDSLQEEKMISRYVRAGDEAEYWLRLGSISDSYVPPKKFTDFTNTGSNPQSGSERAALTILSFQSTSAIPAKGDPLQDWNTREDRLKLGPDDEVTSES